jgi:hypothetical protein
MVAEKLNGVVVDAPDRLVGAPSATSSCSTSAGISRPETTIVSRSNCWPTVASTERTA